MAVVRLPHAHIARPVPAAVPMRPVVAPRPACPLTPTIFHERWWLEVVTGGRYQAAELRNHGQLVGWLPYLQSRRRGFAVSEMPALTHLLGPALDEGKGSSNTRWLRRMDILNELLGRLPALGLFSQTCHPDTPDVMGFQANGFDAFVQFSAEIHPAPEDVLWGNMRDKTRNVIRRAGERSQLETVGDPRELERFYRKNLDLDSRHSYFDLALITSVFEAASVRGQARIFAVRNAAKAIVAAVLYVWDDRRLWYLLSTRDPRFPDNGAVSLLIWHGMQQASRRGLIFDFDGVASTGAARFFAGFGAQIRPRYAVHRSSKGFELVDALLTFARGPKRSFFIAP
ncbi:MAG: hypothetical protein JWQ07_2773 [Ramlibacter sp.]|nr:hypothetical protein [Ramlibacter sp.]